MQALRMADWKAVRPEPNGKLELYNLKADPLEQRDVAAQYPKVVERIEAHMKAARVEPRPQSMPPTDFEKPA